MIRRNQIAVLRYLMVAAIFLCIVIMILSAAAASSMYRPCEDAFTASLGENLSLLCANGDYGLSGTQLELLKNAEVLSIRYDKDAEGNKLFYAKLRLFAPQENAGRYEGNPTEYLKNTMDKFSGGSDTEELDVIGLCSDNAPVVDMEMLDRIAQAADNVWSRESLSSDTHFTNAVIDLLIPEPFPGRKYADGAAYQPAYETWLTECARQFASDGLTVTKDGVQSGSEGDIREAMQNAITPYLCSIRNISLSTGSRKGMYILSFDSLDIIGTIYSSKKPSFAALNKLSGVYSQDRNLKVTIEFDLSGLVNENGKMKLPFFDLIRAITGYGSSIGYSAVKIKLPQESQVIDGKSNGQWPVEFKRAKGDGNVIVSIVKIDDTGEETSVLKLFLTDGGKCTVCLSKGKYRLNMAVGSTYYGSREYFGINGIYMRNEENIYTIPSVEITSITVGKQPGESLSFTDYLIGMSRDRTLIGKAEF